MAGWWEEGIGFCYREESVVCDDGMCGHYDGEKTMTQWMVRFGMTGRITSVNIKAPNFMEAVAKASEYAKERGLAEDSILSIEYLVY